MPDSLIWSTDRYVTQTADLTGGVWTVGDNIYVEAASLKATNKVANAATNVGIVAVVVEAPDPDEAGDRMVLRVTSAVAALQTSLALLWQATEL